MPPFYGWGSTASGLGPLQGGSLLFTTKFTEIPGNHFINSGRMNMATCWSAQKNSGYVTGLLMCKSEITSQASAYEACDCMHMPPHMPKTLETCKKKAHIVWLRKLQGVQQIARLKQQCSLSFIFCETPRSYEKIMCIYLLFHWFNGENCIVRSSHQRCSI